MRRWPINSRQRGNNRDNLFQRVIRKLAQQMELDALERRPILGSQHFERACQVLGRAIAETLGSVSHRTNQAVAQARRILVFLDGGMPNVPRSPDASRRPVAATIPALALAIRRTIRAPGDRQRPRVPARLS